MCVATEHLGEAADTLRQAALIGDPYLRADAIWEALERVRAAADHLRGRAASACGEITRLLEESCDGSAEPPVGEVLIGYART